jgi:hypothetical protein
MRKNVEKVISVHENVNIQKLFYGLSEEQEKLHLRGEKSLPRFYHSGFLEKLLEETKRTPMECNVRRFILERDSTGRK